MHNTIDEVMNVATDTVNAQKELNELLNTQLDVALNVVRIESNMLGALDNLVFSKDVPLACKNMIRMILSENAHLLDDVIFRCYVLRPDGDYLTSYVAQQIPDPDGYERKFYVGGDPLIRGGVAGKAFKENSMEIARRIDDSDPLKGVVFDHEDYVPLDDSVPAPQYRSFICIPLRPDRDTCLGILCLDSEDQSAFDDPDRQQYLSALSTLIAFILELSDKSQQQDTQSDQLPRADQPSKVEIDSTDGDMPCQPS
jgi:hypothetical protein